MTAGFHLKPRGCSNQWRINFKFVISWVTNQLWQLSLVALPRRAIKMSTDRIQNSREEKQKQTHSLPSYCDCSHLTTEPRPALTLKHDGDKQLAHRHAEPMEIIDLIVSFSWNTRQRWIINIFGCCWPSAFCLLDDSLITRQEAELTFVRKLCKFFIKH